MSREADLSEGQQLNQLSVTKTRDIQISAETIRF